MSLKTRQASESAEVDFFIAKFSATLMTKKFLIFAQASSAVLKTALKKRSDRAVGCGDSGTLDFGCTQRRGNDE